MIDLSKYRKPALQFSGGKDSLALLYLLREQLDKVLVYHVDAGDRCPETAAVIEQVKPWVPHFITIQADSKGWRQRNGMPSDLVPQDNHLLGVAYGMSETLISGRFDCCAANLMLPLHNRMLEDKVDCVIRGTKIADTGRVPFDGSSPFYDVLLPIIDWSHEQVFAYLAECGAPENAVYKHFKRISAPECLTCTAWWSDGKAEYLRKRHPAAFAEYQSNLKTIAIQIQYQLNDLNEELT